MAALPASPRRPNTMRARVALSLTCWLFDRSALLRRVTRAKSLPAGTGRRESHSLFIASDDSW